MLNSKGKPFPDRRQFLIKNLIKGLIWLMIIVGGYFFAGKQLNFTLEDVLGPVYDQPKTVFAIFLTSEIIFGIIPPEFFMIWSLRSETLIYYIGNIIYLSVISYMAGVIGFLFGQYLNDTRAYKEVKKRIFGRFEKHLNHYGGFLVIVAAITPVPFSGIAMLVGAVRYSFRKYLCFSLFRFTRFIAYAIIIWEANILN